MRVLIPVLLLFTSVCARVEVHFSNLESVVLNVLKNAKDHVYVSTFSLNSEKVLRELENLSERGLDVRILSETPILRSELDIRVDIDPESSLHAKFIVIDGERVVFGSANFTDSGLVEDKNDLIVIEDEEISRFFTDLFNGVWNGKIDISSFETYIGHFYVGPASDLEGIVLSNLMKAERSVEIVAFAFTDMNVLALLKHLTSLGVDVRMILDDWCVENGSLLNYPMDQFEYRVRRDIHHKFIVIDGRTLITGSANITERAYHSNFEILLVTSDPDLVEKYVERFEDLWR